MFLALAPPPRVFLYIDQVPFVFLLCFRCPSCAASFSRSSRSRLRMLRRCFGSAIPRLLGENLTTATVVQFFSALIAALEVREADTGLPREPRLKITKITPKRVDRTGELRIEITGIYMPRGHLGDFTPEGMRTITIKRSEAGAPILG
jgi:phage baseplate assembly protein W